MAVNFAGTLWFSIVKQITELISPKGPSTYDTYKPWDVPVPPPLFNNLQANSLTFCVCAFGPYSPPTTAETTYRVRHIEGKLDLG